VRKSAQHSNILNPMPPSGRDGSRLRQDLFACRSATHYWLDLLRVEKEKSVVMVVMVI